MAVRGNEIVNGCKVRAYDFGALYADRYTVVYMDDRTLGGYYNSMSMSSNPFHPQGVGMHGECTPGPHLGKRIRIADLPAECVRAVTQDCTPHTITRASPY